MRRHGLELAIRSGGHSYGGYSTCTGLVLDVTRMDDTVVDASSRKATIGAGARLVDVYAACGGAGMALAEVPARPSGSPG